MSNFICDKCGKECIDSQNGYVTGCEHYPKDMPVETWQPIETAPKDGTYVLVSNGRGVWVAKFKDVFQSGWKPDCPWQSMMLNHGHIPHAKRKGSPTHWMPLPEPPNV